jgi:D-3-phosphoglycerate dehydrogenase
MGAVVVLTDQVFPDTDVERSLLAAAEATLEVLDDPSPASIRERARNADALLTAYAPIDGATIAALERCRVIARYGIGVDNIDLDAAHERGIVVTNVPDYCVEEVADHTLALLLAAARKVVAANELVRGGGWGIASLAPVRRLRGRALGLVGYGRIGAAVARRAAAFGLKVSAYDRYVPAERLAADGVSPCETLHELLTGSDFVSVHVPLTAETRRLIGSEAVAAMRAEAVLINTSRGPVVSLDAVVEALRAGRLGAACLDVFEHEPPDAAALEGVPGLLVTPHAAFYSEEAIRESQTKVVEAVLAVLDGREPASRVI